MCPHSPSPLLTNYKVVISHPQSPAFSLRRLWGFIHIEMSCIRHIFPSSWSFSSLLVSAKLNAGSGVAALFGQGGVFLRTGHGP